LENVVRCKYFEADVHIKNTIKNSYQDGLRRTTQTLDHVVVVHILIWDKRKSQINKYNDFGAQQSLVVDQEDASCDYERLDHENIHKDALI